MLLTAKDNPNLKLIRALSRRSGREKFRAFAAEGKRLVEEAVLYAAERIRFFAVSENFEKNNEIFVKMLDGTGKTRYTVKENLFRGICSTENPQGVLAVIDTDGAPGADLRTASRVLVLDGISEPGNLGTILRTAEAAGAEAVLLCGDCTDLYNPKTVRSTMGSVFRVPVISGEAAAVTELKENGFFVVAAALGGAEAGSETVRAERLAIVIGNEAHGVSEEVLRLSDLRLRLPMRGRVESLNAAVAAGILMYQYFGKEG